MNERGAREMGEGECEWGERDGLAAAELMGGETRSGPGSVGTEGVATGDDTHSAIPGQLGRGDETSSHRREFVERERELLEALALREEQLVRREEALRLAVRDRELTNALSRHNLVPGAVEQLVRLWADRFNVVSEGSEFRVVLHDGRSVEAVLSEWLERDEYAHFCAPRTRGGAAKPVGPGGVSSEPGSSPATLGEAIIRSWREATRASTNLHGPIGLGRRGY
jgi:hypothetical protein